MRETVSVILVNYNGRKYNDKCIRSVLNSTVKEHIRIIVLDNASTDGSLEELKDHWGGHSQVQIVSLEENYGFSRANNEGIRMSAEQGAEYFLLLNNDTEIETDAIEHMLKCHLETKGIVVPKILYSDRKDKIWCAGGDFTPIIRKPVQRGLNSRDKGQFEHNEKCEFANGCAMFLSKDIIERNGYLDERFFLYYEDTEYSMRALARDIPIWYCAQAVVYHKVNGSTLGNEKPDNAYYITRNWLLCNYLHRNDVCGRKGWYAVFLLYFVCNRAAWMLIWLMQGKRELCRALIQGIRDYRKQKWGKLYSKAKIW